MPCDQPTERRAVVGDREISYELHRSPRRRKSITLTVEDQRLRILAPRWTLINDIDELLHRRAEWIEERLAAPPPPRLRDRLAPGAQLPLLGQSFPVESGEAPFAFDGRRFLVNAGEADRVRAAERWLREHARADFAERVSVWGERIGVRPRKLQIRDQKTRWGSASSKLTLSLNWRLIFAPPEIVEYVVVHELCHLIQPDHSPAYWRLVESHLPDYRERRQALKDAADSLLW